MNGAMILGERGFKERKKKKKKKKTKQKTTFCTYLLRHTVSDKSSKYLFHFLAVVVLIASTSEHFAQNQLLWDSEEIFESHTPTEKPIDFVCSFYVELPVNPS